MDCASSPMDSTGYTEARRHNAHHAHADVLRPGDCRDSSHFIDVKSDSAGQDDEE